MVPQPRSHRDHSGSFPWWLSGKESTCNAEATGDPASRKFPGGGNGNPLQYSCLENPMDKAAWRDTVHGVAESQTQLSDLAHMHTHTHTLIHICPCHTPPHIHTGLQSHIFTQAHTSSHSHTCLYLHTNPHTCIHTHPYPLTQPPSQAHTLSHNHACLHILFHSHTHVFTHAHTHRHSYARPVTSPPSALTQTLLHLLHTHPPSHSFFPALIRSLHCRLWLCTMQYTADNTVHTAETHTALPKPGDFPAK